MIYIIHTFSSILIFFPLLKLMYYCAILWIPSTLSGIDLVPVQLAIEEKPYQHDYCCYHKQNKSIFYMKGKLNKDPVCCHQCRTYV